MRLPAPSPHMTVGRRGIAVYTWWTSRVHDPGRRGRSGRGGTPAHRRGSESETRTCAARTVQRPARPSHRANLAADPSLCGAAATRQANLALPADDLGNFAVRGRFAVRGDKARVARAEVPRNAEFPRYGRGCTAVYPANRAYETAQGSDGADVS